MFDIPLNDELVLLLVAHLIRLPELMRLAVDRLDPASFDQSERPCALAYALARKFFFDHNGLPSRATLLAEIRATQDFADDLAVSGELTARYDNQINAMFEMPHHDLSVEYGRDLLKRYLDDRVARNEIKDALQVGKSIEEIFEKFAAARRRASLATPALDDPFDDSVPPDFTPPVSTGCDIFDALTGGGTKSGEVVVLLGGTGGGKTMFSIQLATSLALAGDRALYVSYEQGTQGDLRMRAICCAADIQRDAIAGKKYEDFDESTKESYRDARDRIAGRLKLVDRSTEGDTIAEIDSLVEQESAAGRHPRLIIVDWLWPFLMRMAASRESGIKSQSEPRFYAHIAMDQFKSLAERHQTSIMICQQLSTAAAKKKGASASPQWHDAAEATSISWLPQFTLTISPLDPNGYCVFAASKARRSAKRSVVARLDTNFCKFVIPEGDMDYDDATREFVRADARNAMPSGSSDENEMLETGGGAIVA